MKTTVRFVVILAVAVAIMFVMYAFGPKRGSACV